MDAHVAPLGSENVRVTYQPTTNAPLRQRMTIVHFLSDYNTLLNKHSLEKEVFIIVVDVSDTDLSIYSEVMLVRDASQ